MDISAFFYAHHILFLAVLAVVGLVVGSFLNVVIYRLPIILEQDIRTECALYLDQPPPKSQHMTLWQPRSFCPACQKPIAVWMNIPVVSYLLLKGKCFYCKHPINIRYLIVELLSCLVAVTLGIYFGPTLKLVAALIFMWTMLVLLFFDLETKQLPTQIILALLWMGLFFNTYNLFVPLASAVFGAIFGYLFFFFIAWLYRAIRKKEGLGTGDFELLASLGAWFGWQSLPIIVFIASCVGSIFSIVYLLATKQAFNTRIPFGPFLILGGIIILFWGNFIYNSNLYLRSYW